MTKRIFMFYLAEAKQSTMVFFQMTTSFFIFQIKIERVFAVRNNTLIHYALRFINLSSTHPVSRYQNYLYISKFSSYFQKVYSYQCHIIQIQIQTKIDTGFPHSHDANYNILISIHMRHVMSVRKGVEKMLHICLQYRKKIPSGSHSIRHKMFLNRNFFCT